MNLFILKRELLIIGTNFPEPQTTAAGTRTSQLINIFLERDFKISFASTAKISPKSLALETLGIKTHKIEINNSNFNLWIKQLNPTFVIFDRFTTEEKFGWRLREQCPKTISILDTQDLHFLRKAREMAITETNTLQNINLFNDLTKRELASILRCDLSLIISKFEMELLIKDFSISKEILFYLPLFAKKQQTEGSTLKERKDFMTIGNFYHKPNTDAVELLYKDIWPKIKLALPAAKLHIYGAYASEKVNKLHHEKLGFLIKGWVENKIDAYQDKKICLAPLRFGAGIKGKILDAFSFGTPVVTTYVGAEGIFNPQANSLSVTNTLTQFIDRAVLLYKNQELWEQNQKEGYKILKTEFNQEQFLIPFIGKIEFLYKNIESFRKKHFIGAILNYQTLQSTKYLSKWIEEKNKR